MSREQRSADELRAELEARGVVIKETDVLQTQEGALVTSGSTHILDLRRRQRPNSRRQEQVMARALKDIDSGKAANESIITYPRPKRERVRKGFR